MEGKKIGLSQKNGVKNIKNSFLQFHLFDSIFLTCSFALPPSLALLPSVRVSLFLTDFLSGIFRISRPFRGSHFFDSHFFDLFLLIFPLRFLRCLLVKLFFCAWKLVQFV